MRNTAQSAGCPTPANARSLPTGSAGILAGEFLHPGRRQGCRRSQCLPRAAALSCALILSVFGVGLFAQEGSPPRRDSEIVEKIRDEGLNRSQVMETLSYLTEVIGPRLTGSIQHKRANEWTREKMACWGLTNAHLEAWGPFGRGWALRRFSAQVVQPLAIPLRAYPAAWSPGLGKPLVGEVVHLDVSSTEDLDKYKGKLKGAIVLNGRAREIKPRFEPMATRLGETNLLRLANAAAPRVSPVSSFRGRSEDAPEFRRTERPAAAVSGTTNATASGPASPTRSAPPFGGRSGPRNLSFLIAEGAALVVNPSPMGDGGTIFVAAASVPMPESQGSSRSSFTNMPRAWSTNALPTLPQITLATEDYNRLIRMIEKGEKVKMAVDLEAEFQDQDLMAYNTIAELPGTDLKDEVVMVGGHLDSWHAGTGATDNAVGVAAAMEAVRILKDLKLQPRRTIRVALWAGEEQGYLGSRAYVAKHFGYYTNAAVAEPRLLRAPKDESNDRPVTRSSSTNSAPARKLVRLAEYEKLSAYFNLDNGAGRIRGIYLQGNEAVAPLFRRWLQPFRDLDAETISLSNTGGTDHIPFNSVGLPGFQFIQDPLDYNSRSHHSNDDVLDRIVTDDVKQAATILAAFVYHTAMLDEKLPRKPVEEGAR